MKRTILFAITLCMLLSTLMPGFALASGQVWDDGVPITQISSSGHTLALKEDGTVWAWGRNTKGQIGIGSNGTFTPDSQVWYTVTDTYPQRTPVYVMDGIAKISASAHSMAVGKDGSLWAWGDGSDGQLGDGKLDVRSHLSIPTNEKTDDGMGTYTYILTQVGINLSNVPIKVMESGVKDVAAGGYHTLVLMTDGSVWAFGWNRYGQIGVPDAPSVNLGNNVLTPVKVMDGVSSIAAGGSSSYAIKTDGSLWAWGHNYYGQIGNGKMGSSEIQETPLKIMDDVKNVLGGAAVMAIKNDGSLWAWGNNTGGQLGFDDSEANILTPRKVADGVTFASIGYRKAYYVTTDNHLYGCGNVAPQATQGYIKLADDVKEIHPGTLASLLVKTDCSLWTWFEGTSYDARYEAPPPQMGLGDLTSDQLLSHNDIDKALLLRNATDNPSQTPTDPPEQPPATLTALPTSSTVMVNGENVAFDAYHINGHNFFKLRDIAYTISGTPKQFAVWYDEETTAITLTSGMPYTPVGGEMVGKGSQNQSAYPTFSTIYLDGKVVQFTAYIIGGNNYFKLRDIGEAFDFGVDWDEANSTILIDTSKGYTPG